MNFVERLSVLWPGEEMSLGRIPSAMLPRVRGAPPPSVEEQRAVLEMWQMDHEETANGEEAPAVAINWAAKIDPPRINTEGGLMTAVDLKKLLADYEESWIRESLKVSLGNITHAADLLGLPRTTFIERLRKYELSASRR